MKVIAGEVGSVQGYQVSVGSSSNVAGWFTLFLDASGNYLSGTFYEDDDNGLTIMKGNATLSTGDLTSGATFALDIAGTISGFTTTALNATGTCTLTANGTTYSGVSYQRLL